MAPSAAGMDQRRHRAVLRVMEKMLNDESLDQTAFWGKHDAFSVKLWKATRCMSGEEFLLAVEERVLGDGMGAQPASACAYPGCSVVWGAAEASAVTSRVASGSCCSVVCAEHVAAHAARLGSVKDASARFTGLYELAKREREEMLRLARDATGAQTAGQAGPSSETNGKRTPSGDTPKFAAGTAKTPIMHAVITERSPGASPASAQTKRDESFDADVVDGYRLKRHEGSNGNNGPRRVRFAPNEQLEQKREFRSNDPPGEVTEAPTTGVATPVAVETDAETETATATDADATHIDTAEQSETGAPAQFVFSIEDPRGPVDDDMKSIGDMFGTLNVLVPEEEEVSEEAHASLSALRAPHAPRAGSADGDIQPVDTILARTMRDGAKHFPHLNIPDDVARQIKALETELADEERGAVVEPPAGDNDSELDGFETIDSDFFSTDEDEDVPIRCQKTFFTQIYTFFDYWITDASIEMTRGDGHGARASTGSTASTASIASTPPAPVPQVPEVATAMQRFISIGCTALAAKLCDGIDGNDGNDGIDGIDGIDENANVDKQTIVDRIARLAGTFRLDAALPAFDSKQWLVVCLAMLKALSANSHPHFQKLTETPAGAARVGEILGDACFTAEELLAVVSLLLGAH